MRELEEIYQKSIIMSVGIMVTLILNFIFDGKEQICVWLALMFSIASAIGLSIRYYEFKKGSK